MLLNLLCTQNEFSDVLNPSARYDTMKPDMLNIHTSVIARQAVPTTVTSSLTANCFAKE